MSCRRVALAFAYGPGSLAGMATPTTRRAFGRGGDRRSLYVEVDQPAIDRLDELHSATGAPKWAVIQALLEHVEVDENGVPVWWPVKAMQQEALDIPA